MHAIRAADPDPNIVLPFGSTFDKFPDFSISDGSSFFQEAISWAVVSSSTRIELLHSCSSQATSPEIMIFYRVKFRINHGL